MTKNGITRRGVMRSGAGVAAAGALGAPMVHAQGTAGSLRFAFWDHWVPGANAALQQLAQRWGERNRVNMTLDFINTTDGNQLQLTIAAQAQSRSGHDGISLLPWDPGTYASQLEPCDDVMQRLVAKYGAREPGGGIPRPARRRLARRAGHGGHPDQAGLRPLRPPAAACRHRHPRHVAGAQRARPDGRPVDLGHFPARSRGLPSCGRPLRTADGPVHRRGGLGGRAVPVLWLRITDERGNPTIRGNQELRQAIDYAVRLSRFLPNDVWAWDDASNNRALISGRSALIFNPPSAWAVAKRDAPQVAENCWTVPMPAGPRGRFLAYLPYITGIWAFGRNKTAAKAFLEFISERENAELCSNLSQGYDIPPFLSMADFKVWEEQGPPVGTIFNYPLKAHQQATYSIAFSPARRSSRSRCTSARSTPS